MAQWRAHAQMARYAYKECQPPTHFFFIWRRFPMYFSSIFLFVDSMRRRVDSWLSDDLIEFRPSIISIAFFLPSFRLFSCLHFGRVGCWPKVRRLFVRCRRRGRVLGNITISHERLVPLYLLPFRALFWISLPPIFVFVFLSSSGFREEKIIIIFFIIMHRCQKGKHGTRARPSFFRDILYVCALSFFFTDGLLFFLLLLREGIVVCVYGTSGSKRKERSGVRRARLATKKGGGGGGWTKK